MLVVYYASALPTYVVNYYSDTILTITTRKRLNESFFQLNRIFIASRYYIVQETPTCPCADFNDMQFRVLQMRVSFLRKDKMAPSSFFFVVINDRKSNAHLESVALPIVLKSF